MYDISDEDFSKTLMTYHPLPHRLQYIGEACGIRFYDDSISTICDTTIQALKSLPDTDAVLIGGMDRGIDYSELIQFLSVCDVPHIILMEATGRRNFLRKSANIIRRLMAQNESNWFTIWMERLL